MGPTAVWAAQPAPLGAAAIRVPAVFVTAASPAEEVPPEGTAWAVALVAAQALVASLGARALEAPREARALEAPREAQELEAPREAQELEAPRERLPPAEPPVWAEPRVVLTAALQAREASGML